MRLSTLSRYGLRAMVTIARNHQTPISSDKVAEYEDVSKKYLDGILSKLRTAGLLKSFKGQGGGYILARPPEEIRAGDVVRILESGFAVVPCVDDPSKCEKAGRCPTREVWCAVSAAAGEVLNRITLADLTAWEPGMEPQSLMYHI
ncbi:MAG: Rrf2 family transcriptional regulator [bacterium]|nr:MAG: Rrf2 family transcriptional regulator [bacterium]